VQLDVERRAWQVAGTEKRHQLPSGIELGLVAAHTELQDERQAGIRFFADGSSSGGQVIVSAAGRRFLVDVDWLTGRVSIHD
jgi:general secretion pathway protein H